MNFGRVGIRTLAAAAISAPLLLLGTGLAAADSTATPQNTGQAAAASAPAAQGNAASKGPDVKPMSANGCTTAPGTAGAHNCVVVEGDGTHITAAYSQYYYAQPVGSNVCERTHQFLYTNSSGASVTREVAAGDCVNPAAMVVTGDSMELPEAPLDVAANTPFCTRAKNTATDGQWSSYACITIEP